MGIITALGVSSPARGWLTCETLESAIECKFRHITNLGCNIGKAPIGIAKKLGRPLQAPSRQVANQGLAE